MEEDTIINIAQKNYTYYKFENVLKKLGRVFPLHRIYIKFYIYIGHLTRLGTRNDVVVQKEFVADLQNAATIANQEVLFSKVAQQVGHFDNPWLIFSKYIDAVNENCTQAMLPKWENRLGGALEFMSTHCFSMSEAERVDPTLQALTMNSTFIYK